MGEAKRRGNFEERKTQAIKEGRAKTEALNKPTYLKNRFKGSSYYDNPGIDYLFALMGCAFRPRKRI